MWFEERYGSSLQYRNAKSWLCIVIRGASWDPGAPLIQWTCNGTTNSLWYRVAPEDA